MLRLRRRAVNSMLGRASSRPRPEALGEIQLVAIDGDRAMGRASRGGDRGGNIARIHGEIPANGRALKFQRASHVGGGRDVNLLALDLSEQPEQQVEEMNADVGNIIFARPLRNAPHVDGVAIRVERFVQAL